MPTGKCAKPIWEPMSSLLSVESLSVRYGRVDAVRGASITVGEGEIVAVLGANGAGKSSLLKGILGLVPLDQGAVRFGGRDLAGAPPAQRIAAGMVLVPEGRRIVMSLTVEENLLMGAYLRRDAPALLLVEQNTRQALRLCTRAYVMELGAIVMQDRALLDDQRLVAAYLGGSR